MTKIANQTSIVFTKTPDGISMGLVLKGDDFEDHFELDGLSSNGSKAQRVYEAVQAALYGWEPVSVNEAVADIAPSAEPLDWTPAARLLDAVAYYAEEDNTTGRIVDVLCSAALDLAGAEKLMEKLRTALNLAVEAQKGT